MDLTSESTSWIYASTSGEVIKSNSPSEGIRYHEKRGVFSLDLSKASVGASLNPFIASAPSISEGSDTNESSGGLGFAVPIHGLMMSLAFVIGFPLGSILIRLASMKGLVWIHASLQLLTYIAGFLGAALGVYVANRGADQVRKFSFLD